tara:strand:+ start:129 stop:608 length:480 start_codon:yes stop_codon:yes gene_type:complete
MKLLMENWRKYLKEGEGEEAPRRKRFLHDYEKDHPEHVKDVVRQAAADYIDEKPSPGGLSFADNLYAIGNSIKNQFSQVYKQAEQALKEKAPDAPGADPHDPKYSPIQTLVGGVGQELRDIATQDNPEEAYGDWKDSILQRGAGEEGDPTESYGNQGNY